MTFINYAHRGASEYRPENTFCSFYLGWQMGANGIETDVQRTKDGVLVLFHDDDLMRIAGRPESIADLTYDEVRQIDVGVHKGTAFAGEHIPTFEEFLHHFGNKRLHLAIEIKQENIEQDLIDIIRKYQCDNDYTIITSFKWDPLVAVRRIAPDLKTGYLCKHTDDSLLENMQREGIWQYCPRASDMTEEWVGKFRAAGFSIRAWGVTDEALMQRVLLMKADGMTINFPDKLQKELCRDSKF